MYACSFLVRILVCGCGDFGSNPSYHMHFTFMETNEWEGASFSGLSFKNNSLIHWFVTFFWVQDIEYLKLYSSKHGKEAALSLMERRGVYLGPERYTLDHGPIDLMRADIYQACNFEARILFA